MKERDRNKKGKRIIIRCVKIFAVAVVIIFLLRTALFPPYKQPRVTGGLAVKIREFTWEDEAREETFSENGENRMLTVKFWYPEEAGSYPLVIFSHGAFGVIDSNFSTCMELASHGYVVASIAHPYHAMFVKDVNGRVTTANPDFVKQVFAINNEDDPDVREKMYHSGQEWMTLRVADEEFVLDTILARAEKGEEAPFSLVDGEKIGLFGHSMGGASSVALGRIRKDEIGAVIDLEGTMLGEYVGFENGREIFNSEPYPVPLLDVNSKAVREAASIKNGEYINYYVGKNAICFREVIFNDAGHLNFTDLPLASPILARFLGVGEVNARECIENVNHVVLNWFDCYLKGKEPLDIKDEY